jgi:hypothetical protein
MACAVFDDYLRTLCVEMEKVKKKRDTDDQ